MSRVARNPECVPINETRVVEATKQGVAHDILSPLNLSTFLETIVAGKRVENSEMQRRRPKGW